VFLEFSSSKLQLTHAGGVEMASFGSSSNFFAGSSSVKA